MKALLLLSLLILQGACSEYDNVDIRDKSAGFYEGVKQSYVLQNNELINPGQELPVTFSVFKVEDPFHLGILLEGTETTATQITGVKNAYTFNLGDVMVDNQTLEGYAGGKNERGVYEGTFLTETREVIFYLKNKKSNQVFKYSGIWISEK
jgi:hypothetical protein